jgi:hypothetical protein
MTAGELFIESPYFGLITHIEIDWLLGQQGRFSKAEQAALQRLGLLLDQGQIQLGCRISPQRLRHGQLLKGCIEPHGQRCTSSVNATRLPLRPPIQLRQSGSLV